MARSMMAAAIAALTFATAPAGARCWQIDKLASGDFVFIDLEGNTYTEYRIVGPVTPPAAQNPANYDVIFTQMIERDLDSDAVVGSAIVAEARYPGVEKMVMLDEAHSRIDLRIDGGTHLTDQGDAIGLIKLRAGIIARDPLDSVAGRAIYDRAIAGGAVHMRFTYRDADKPSLDAAMDGVFRPNPAYQAAARAQARGYAAEKQRKGVCPLQQKD